MIFKKMGEYDIEFPILTILSRYPKGLTTTELKQMFKSFSQPAGVNLKDLVNRNDQAIDQIVRNIVSHRNDSKNNMIFRGLINYDNGKMSITHKGIEYLDEMAKMLYKESMK